MNNNCKAPVATMSPHPSPEPAHGLLIDAIATAKLCGISRSAWYKLIACGRTPAPIRLGGVVRWSHAEIISWVQAGCPPRDQWENSKKAQRMRVAGQ